MSKGKSRPPHIHDRLQLFSVMVEGEEQISERQFLKMKVGLVARVEDGGWFNKGWERHCSDYRRKQL